MKTISISDLSKKPSILDDIDDVAQIVNKKTNKIKGFFISYDDFPYVKDIIKEIEYQKWYRRNKGLANPPKEFEGLFDEAIAEIGEKL